MAKNAKTQEEKEYYEYQSEIAGSMIHGPSSHFGFPGANSMGKHGFFPGMFGGFPMASPPRYSDKKERTEKKQSESKNIINPE